MTHSPHLPGKDPSAPAAFPPEEPNLIASASSPPAGPHAAANDTEEIYYAGSPLLRGEIGHGILWIILGLVFLAGPIIYHEISNHLWLPYWWLNVGLVVLGLIFILIPYIKAKSIRYRITNYRIDVQHGLLTTSIDTIELWHVEDLRFHQSLLAKIFGIGDITIISKHPTIPILVMRSLPNSRHLFTELEQRVIAVKRLSSVVKVDPGT
jgi:membrane protein YdbS with pleckstrin-like domain